MRKTKVTFATSTYNSATYISDFLQNLYELCSTNNYQPEIIVVDDHSNDGTWELLAKRAKTTKNLKVIRFSRNYGQQIAVSAALRFSSVNSDVVVLLDSDGQHPLNKVPEMVQNVLSGYDIVYTVSKVRNNKIDAITSRIFWYFSKMFIRPKMIENQLMFKAFSMQAINFINLYKEGKRVLSAIVTDIGLKSLVIEVENQKSRVNSRNHKFTNRVSIMMELVLSGSSRLLDKVIMFSSFSVAISSLFFIYSLLKAAVFGNPPSGYLTFITLILFFGNSCIALLGLVARFISNVYFEVLERPLYLVEKKINVE